MCGVHNIQFVPIFKRYVLESALLIAYMISYVLK